MQVNKNNQSLSIYHHLHINLYIYIYTNLRKMSRLMFSTLSRRFSFFQFFYLLSFKGKRFIISLISEISVCFFWVINMSRKSFAAIFSLLQLHNFSVFCSSSTEIPFNFFNCVFIICFLLYAL